MSKSKKSLVILNQAANYLTIGYANAFSKAGYQVHLLTGSVHTQGEELSDLVHVVTIARWHEAPTRAKITSYIKGMWQMWWLLMTSYKKSEVFFVSVPPMAYLLNLILPHKFSMMIWDVYPDIFKITGMSENHWVYRLWTQLNKWSFRRANTVFTMSDRMKVVLGQYAPLAKIQVQPIWSIFQAPEPVPIEHNLFVQEHQIHDKFIVQYSGNIGLTHNVELLIDLADILKADGSILFQIIGRGPRKQHLEQLVKERNLPNCMFLPFQSDEMFPHSLSAANIGVVILDESVSKGSVPSKSYNLMAMGIPSLYFSAPDSELADYANKFKHAKCFGKSQLQEAAEFVQEMASNPVLRQQYSTNSLKAAAYFKRSNADALVSAYTKHSYALN